MKKVIVILSALVLCATTASAQSWLEDFLKVATDKVGDVISGKSSATTAFDIKGSWKYQGVAIGASSGDILSSLATSAGAGTIEKKCDDLLAKAGIKPGAATLNFKEDGSFTLNAGKINIPGTWTKEGSKLTINFAKLFTFKLVGTIKTPTSSWAGYPRSSRWSTRLPTTPPSLPSSRCSPTPRAYSSASSSPSNKLVSLCEVSHRQGHHKQNNVKMKEVSWFSGHLLRFGYSPDLCQILRC